MKSKVRVLLACISLQVVRLSAYVPVDLAQKRNGLSQAEEVKPVNEGKKLDNYENENLLPFSGYIPHLETRDSKNVLTDLNVESTSILPQTAKVNGESKLPANARSTKHKIIQYKKNSNAALKRAVRSVEEIDSSDIYYGHDYPSDEDVVEVRSGFSETMKDMADPIQNAIESLKTRTRGKRDVEDKPKYGKSKQDASSPLVINRFLHEDMSKTPVNANIKYGARERGYQDLVYITNGEYGKDLNFF